MMDEVVARLQKEYCPPLDSALLSAILSDFDLTANDGLNNARAVLDPLKENAIIEEQADFDPSGTSASQDGFTDSNQTESYGETGVAWTPDSESTNVASTPDTDISNSPNEAASLRLEDKPDSAAAQHQPDDAQQDPEQLDEDTKLQWLCQMFGEQVRPYTIHWTLKKCGGRWNPTVEELLNQVYYADPANDSQEMRVDNKGIDAFSEDNSVGSKTKKKRRRRRQDRNLRRSSSLGGSPSQSRPQSPGPSQNKWHSAGDDINFIAKRTSLSSGAIASVYHKSGASISATLGALLKASLADSSGGAAISPNFAEQVHQLSKEFPTIKPEYLSALLRVSHSSIKAARELAQVLTASPKDVPSGDLQIIPRYAQLKLECEDEDSKASSGPRASSSTAAGLADRPVASRRDAYLLKADTAHAQASAAHRKAKSDALMGGAAAYYADERRKNTERASAISAEIADQTAASQSTSTELDLHNIDMLNGVRIARAKTEEWWRDLGEARFNGRIGAESRQSGFRIVVGLGRHSEGGKGKLGPAVSKMLIQEGWKVEPAGAVLIVKGPKRK